MYAVVLWTVTWLPLPNGVRVCMPCTIPHKWLIHGKDNTNVVTGRCSPSWKPSSPSFSVACSLYPHICQIQLTRHLPSPGRRSKASVRVQISSSAKGQSLSRQPISPTDALRADNDWYAMWYLVAAASTFTSRVLRQLCTRVLAPWPRKKRSLNLSMYALDQRPWRRSFKASWAWPSQSRNSITSTCVDMRLPH